MPYEVGSIVEGTVTSITNYGAFVKLEDGTIGLVHISEIAKDYVRNVSDYLAANQVVKAKVISIENEKRIGLSMKEVEGENIQPINPVNQERPVNNNFRPNNRNNYREKREKNQDFKPANESLSFEDRLSRFMKDSEEKMQDIKRNFESKRGGGYKKSAQY